MTFYVVGLGNPGVGYANTRHNTGRILLEMVAARLGFLEWEEKSKIKLHIADGKIGRHNSRMQTKHEYGNYCSIVGKVHR